MTENTLSIDGGIGEQLMLAFSGREAPEYILQWIAGRPLGGFTLFRQLNVGSAAQVRRLTASLQDAATRAGRPPLLIAADQEGGQLIGLGEETTLFPGNMALGAAGDAALARRVGQAMGRELGALGVNVDYAPVCDVNSNSLNPNVGIRAFGDDPALVAELAAAMIEGLQSAGVAATAKHFPGNGESGLDPHFGVPVVQQERGELDKGALLPFRAAIAAGVQLMMSAHVALPALTGRSDLPATVQSAIMHGLLRGEMGFAGVSITDAMDMGAISQGAGQLVDAIAALRAGIDLLLLTDDPEGNQRLFQGLELAASRQLLDRAQVTASLRRVRALKQWLVQWPQPSLDVVGCAEHQSLAREVAERALTLVRDDDKLLPLRLAADDRVAIVMPRPADLTPADTSSYVTPCLAAAMRAYHPRVDEFFAGQAPRTEEIAALRDQLVDFDLIVLVTLSASLQPAQADLARALLALERPTITVAARTPYDIVVYPEARTHLCTYSIQPPSLKALAAALFGQAALPGRLPVQLSPT